MARISVPDDELVCPGVNLSEAQGDTLVPVRVKPRARKNGLDGEHNGALVVAVTAAPVDGEANAAVIKVLCDALNCPRSAVSIVRGHKSREKVMRVALAIDEVRRRLSD